MKHINGKIGLIEDILHTEVGHNFFLKNGIYVLLQLSKTGLIKLISSNDTIDDMTTELDGLNLIKKDADLESMLRSGRCVFEEYHVVVTLQYSDTIWFGGDVYGTMDNLDKVITEYRPIK